MIAIDRLDVYDAIASVDYGHQETDELIVPDVPVAAMHLRKNKAQSSFPVHQGCKNVINWKHVLTNLPSNNLMSRYEKSLTYSPKHPNTSFISLLDISARYMISSEGVRPSKYFDALMKRIRQHGTEKKTES